MDDDIKEMFWTLADYAKEVQESSISLPRLLEVLGLAIQLKLRHGYCWQWIEDFNDKYVLP